MPGIQGGQVILRVGDVDGCWGKCLKIIMIIIIIILALIAFTVCHRYKLFMHWVGAGISKLFL